jgi:hypothetical protein
MGRFGSYLTAATVVDLRRAEGDLGDLTRFPKGRKLSTHVTRRSASREGHWLAFYTILRVRAHPQITPAGPEALTGAR